MCAWNQYLAESLELHNDASANNSSCFNSHNIVR